MPFQGRFLKPLNVRSQVGPFSQKEILAKQIFSSAFYAFPLCTSMFVRQHCISPLDAVNRLNKVANTVRLLLGQRKAKVESGQYFWEIWKAGGGSELAHLCSSRLVLSLSREERWSQTMKEIDRSRRKANRPRQSWCTEQSDSGRQKHDYRYCFFVAKIYSFPLLATCPHLRVKQKAVDVAKAVKEARVFGRKGNMQWLQYTSLVAVDGSFLLCSVNLSVVLACHIWLTSCLTTECAAWQEKTS